MQRLVYVITADEKEMNSKATPEIIPEEAFLAEGPLNAEVLSELFHVESHKTR
jgi:hypothetical protein